MVVKRLYLDALIESYIVMRERLRDEYPDDAYMRVVDEITRLCEVQRGLGHKDYFERLAA